MPARLAVLPANSPAGPAMREDAPAYLTVERVAARIGVNRKTLYAQIAAGAFPPARRLGARIVIPVAALARWEAGE